MGRTLVVGGFAEEVLRRKPWRWALSFVGTMYTSWRPGTYSLQYLVPAMDALRVKNALLDVGFSHVRASPREASGVRGEAQIDATMLPESGVDLAGGQRLVAETLDTMGVSYRLIGSSSS